MICITKVLLYRSVILKLHRFQADGACTAGFSPDFLRNVEKRKVVMLMGSREKNM